MIQFYCSRLTDHKYDTYQYKGWISCAGIKPLKVGERLYFSVTSPFPSAQGHQLRIWTSNVNACFVGTTDNPSLSFVPYPNKMCYRFSFLAECTVAGTMYPDMLEKSLITIFEEEGPNVILQHNSLRLLKTESFQKMYVHRQLGHLDTFFPTLPPLQLQKMSFACVHCPPLSEHSG